MVAKWKQRGTDYYCTNCFMRPQADIEYICPNCGAMMSNYEEIMDEFFIAKMLTEMENYDIIKEEKEERNKVDE